MYVAILGRQPALGIAELESLYGSKSITPLPPFVCLIDVDKIDFDRLGGSQKLGKVITTLPTNDWQTIIKHISAALPQHLQQIPEGKIKFGISVYGMNISPSKINAGALQMKKVIKSGKRGVRVVPNKEAHLSTAQVLHNGLTSSTGIEILVIKSGKKTYLARTTQVQNITAYAQRDQNRPMRDARVGMLPPKLAQIIINLALAQQLPTGNPKVASHPEKESAKPATLQDPFCGTGVILQEALLMGSHVVGTDIDERMVQYAKKNIEWLKKTFQVNGYLINIDQGDAITIDLSVGVDDTLACETFLGRPLSSLPDPQTLQKIINDCDTIHTKFLKNVARQTQSGFRMCIAVPAWKTPQGFKHLKTLDSLEKLGYNRIKFVHASDQDLIYHRPGQIVARELLVLTRK